MKLRGERIPREKTQASNVTDALYQTPNKVGHDGFHAHSLLGGVRSGGARVALLEEEGRRRGRLEAVIVCRGRLAADFQCSRFSFSVGPEEVVGHIVQKTLIFKPGSQATR